MGVRGHVLADEVALATFKRLRRPPEGEAWDRIVREAEVAAERWEREGWVDEPRAFHVEPPVLEAPQLSRSRALGLTVERLKFPSGWTPPPGVPGRDRWVRYSANATGRATVLRHQSGPRPWVVLVHGTEMGRDLDLRSFRVRKLYHELGANIVLPILPLHGPRRAPRDAGAQFPTLDVMDNVHGLAHAASDVRRILSWIRDQDATRVAMVGVSLGGYVTALVAGLETVPLDCVLPVIPPTDMPALFRRQSPEDLRARLDPLLTASEIVHAVVAPLQFETPTPHRSLAIAAGLADKLIDPVEQVAPLWHHWGRPEILWYPGGHVGHLVRRDLRTFIDDQLLRTGMSVR